MYFLCEPNSALQLNTPYFLTLDAPLFIPTLGFRRTCANNTPLLVACGPKPMICSLSTLCTNRLLFAPPLYHTHSAKAASPSLHKQNERRLRGYLRAPEQLNVASMRRSVAVFPDARGGRLRVGQAVAQAALAVRVANLRVCVCGGGGHGTGLGSGIPMAIAC